MSVLLIRSLLLPQLFAILFVVVFSACSEPAEDQNELTDSTSATVLGFPDSVWVEKGIPNPNEHWHSEDFATAYAVFKKEQHSGSGYLPRMDPSAGSQTFARITSLHNLEIMQADSLNAYQRMMAGAEILQPFTEIYLLYVNKAEYSSEYKQELIEMMISMLHVQEELMMIVREYISTVPVEDREAEQFIKSIAQIQKGLTQTVSGVIRVLRDKEMFTRAQLEQLANILRNTGSELLANLDQEYQDELEIEAARTVQAVDNPVIESALESLFPFVQNVADTLAADTVTIETTE